MKKRIIDDILKSKNFEKIDMLEYEDTLFTLFGLKTREWCPWCKCENTFKHGSWTTSSHIGGEVMVHPLEVENGKIYARIATCSHDDNHKILYFVSEEEHELTKFAEWPFDFIKHKIPQPKGELLKKLGLDNLLIKAYLSAQNDLYLGASLYARRVLEGVIDFLRNDDGQNYEFWQSKTLGQKIDAVKDKLPSWVKNNISITSSILGDIIHNYSDDEAKTNYNLIISIIKFIVEKIETDKNEKEMEKNLQTQLNAINNK